METVFATSTNHEIELIDAKNKIKELEKKIADLTYQLEYTIKENMNSQYVEDWTFIDTDGKKGDFSGIISWIKCSGLIFYKDGTKFEGDWDSSGEINDGELRNTHSNELITRWVDGVEVDEEEDEDD